MRVWVATVGEPLPSDPGGQRLHRAGILCRMLAERGHEVLWWTGTFDHTRKRPRFPLSTGVNVARGLRIQCLHGQPYRRNVSLARLANHWQVAREFDRLAPGEPPPDVILAAMPTIDLAYRAVAYGRRCGVPTLVDIRDFWPDIWVEVAPAPVRGLTSYALWPYERMLRAALRNTNSIIGFTEGAIDWALAKIGRQRGTSDLAFPFGYDASPPSAEDLASAERFWDATGIRSSNDAFTACFVGSLSHRLSLERLVDAAALVSPHVRPRINFVLCGDGEARASLAARARGLEHVYLPGWVNRAQIWALLRRSHVGLLPYPRSADFLCSIPNKAVEYLSGGLPIVTSMRGEMAALIARTGCGVVLDEETPDAVTKAILRLAGDPAALRSLRERAAVAFGGLTADVVYGRLIDHMAALADAGGIHARMRLTPPWGKA